MKLRTAVKIMRGIHGDKPWLAPYWGSERVYKARVLARRKEHDRRFPYIPTDEELTELFGFRMSLFADLFIEDDGKREEFKEQLWSELGQ